MDDNREEYARFSHLLGSPLTALRGAIDLLRRPRRLPDDPLIRDLLDALERNYTRLRLVVDTLLEYSQVVDGQVRVAAPLSAFIPEHATSAAPTAPALESTAEIMRGPAREPAAAAAEADERPLAGAADVTGTVLLVEDSATYRTVLRMLLQGAGYTVLEALNGIQGVDLARSHHPDLIGRDMELPLLSGQQVAQVLREDPDTKIIPLIFLSGYTRLDQAPTDIEVVPKTAAPTALLDVIQRTVAAGRLRAE